MASNKIYHISWLIKMWLNLVSKHAFGENKSSASYTFESSANAWPDSSSRQETTKTLFWSEPMYEEISHHTPWQVETISTFK